RRAPSQPPQTGRVQHQQQGRRQQPCARRRPRRGQAAWGPAQRGQGRGRERQCRRHQGDERRPRLLRARRRRLPLVPAGEEARVYFWLKLLHIGAVLVWFCGLFFLPRLFVARHRGGRDADPAYFNPVANLLFFRIATPAGLVAIALGMVLIAMVPFGAWLAAKLLVVMAAVLLHLYFGLH